MKSFLVQYHDCVVYNLVKEGKMQTFKQHPELLPAAVFMPRFSKMRKAIDSGELIGFRTLDCLRFGGECNSGNKRCQKLRKKNIHVCQRVKPFCMCSVDGLEPDEDCPVHGWPHPREENRCSICGRFMKWKKS